MASAECLPLEIIAKILTFYEEIRVFISKIITNLIPIQDRYCHELSRPIRFSDIEKLGLLRMKLFTRSDSRNVYQCYNLDTHMRLSKKYYYVYHQVGFDAPAPYVSIEKSCY